MNRANITLASTVVAAALGLALGFGAAPAQAGVDCTDLKFATHKQCAGDTGGGGAGGGQSGKHTPIVASINTVEFLEQDDPADYENNADGVKAQYGGETGPNRAGFVVSLRGTGQDFRTVEVQGECVNIDLGDDLFVGGVDGCKFLIGRDPVFGVQRSNLNLAVRPYEIGCPETLENGQCPDVFTMGGITDTAEMSFRVLYHEGILLEIASAIGGPDAPNPGRCLSILFTEDEDVFDEYRSQICLDPEDCDVTVTVEGQDDNGRNNHWTAKADDATGLLCSRFGELRIIGAVTGIDFVLEAEEK